MDATQTIKKKRTYTPEQIKQRRIIARRSAAKQRAENHEKYLEDRRRWRTKHRAQVYAANRAWALANPDKVKAYHKRSRDANKAAYKKIAERWRAKHPDARVLFCAARRAKIRDAGGTFTEPEWVAMKAKYGQLCLACGQRKKLTVDHIIAIDCGGRHEASNIQPLCLSCNSSKGNKTIDYRPAA